eukprot:2506779-Prymnesium_polylepis.1
MPPPPPNDPQGQPRTRTPSAVTLPKRAVRRSGGGDLPGQQTSASGTLWVGTVCSAVSRVAVARA